jgi:hypothetical protein
LPTGIREKLDWGLYTGGATHYGERGLAGELGPEAWISRTGKMKMLGLNGPEIVSPGEGAVIPASATRDPFRGSMGLTPGWAQEAFRKVASARIGDVASTATTSGGKTVTYGETTVSIGPIYASQDIDVERAVHEGLRKAEQERGERA